MKVLFAHSSHATRAGARRTLEHINAEVLDAHDMDQTMRVWRAERPDVALVEWAMCEGHGPELIEAIKRDPELSETALIVLDDPPLEEALERLRLGAHDLLRDPSHAGELAARVLAAATRKEISDTLRRWTSELPDLVHADPLTRVLNRRALTNQLSKLIASAQRHRRPLAVALIDADHFKEVNDNQGHAAGDALLVRIARSLEGILRESDHVGRWGGDEFLLLLPDTDADGAAAVCRKVADSCPVSLSVGWSVLLDPDDTVETVVERADQAMYRAKRAGGARASS